MIMDKRQLRKQMLEIRKNLPPGQCMAAGQKVCHQLLQWDKYISAKRILAYYPCRNELDIRPLLADAFAQGKTVAFPKVTGPGQMVFITVSGFDELKPGAMNIPEPIMPEAAAAAPVDAGGNCGSRDHCSSGSSGHILEPATIAADGIPTLMLVPGVAFCSIQKTAETACMGEHPLSAKAVCIIDQGLSTETGCVDNSILTYGRMGYGGGYYDRYLWQCRDCGQKSTALITCGIAYEFQLVPPGVLPLEDHDMQLDHLIWG